MNAPVTPLKAVDAAARELALAEYSEIKSEQRSRIDRRDYLLYAVLVGAGAVFAASAGHAAYLLGLPALCLILGWNYCRNDAMISAIGAYFAEHPVLGEALGWERDHKDDVLRIARKRVQLAVDVAAFPGVGLAGLIAWWATAPAPAGLLALSAAEALVLAALAAWMLAEAGVPVAQARAAAVRRIDAAIHRMVNR